jgi:hypothetical protein
MGFDSVEKEILLAMKVHPDTLLILQIIHELVAMAETDNPDADPVHERVDQVIQDVSAGRVVPRKVDELSTAVERAKRDRAVGRVTKKS